MKWTTVRHTRLIFSQFSLKNFRLFVDNFSKGEKNLLIDCHINCEDVILGLALQNCTPFRFNLRKAWCTYGFLESEYSFKNYDFLAFANPNVIHLFIRFLLFKSSEYERKRLFS